ncbi:hypothetical protein ACFWP5_10140 [Streptomyces sp. NPDC058469]|uniref:hypothetical protein n=1 Tax=Streptomyces sp. NPDC058469 TaxID=3346514 RepID=UPI00364DDFFF
MTATLQGVPTGGIGLATDFRAACPSRDVHLGGPSAASAAEPPRPGPGVTDADAVDAHRPRIVVNCAARRALADAEAYAVLAAALPAPPDEKRGSGQ